MSASGRRMFRREMAQAAFTEEDHFSSMAEGARREERQATG